MKAGLHRQAQHWTQPEQQSASDTPNGPWNPSSPPKSQSQTRPILPSPSRIPSNLMIANGPIRYQIYHKAQSWILKTLSSLFNLFSDPTRQNIILRFTKASAKRATATDPLDNFISISVTNIHTNHDPPMKGLGGHGLSSTPATARESADYVTLLLQCRMNISGIMYNFYGHSNSRLKSRACILFVALEEEIARKVREFGDFMEVGIKGSE